MPLLNYVCDCGEVTKKYFKAVKDSPSVVKCICGLEARKGFGTTSSSYKITIDNGLQSRAVTVDPNIIEINDARSAKDYSQEDD